MKSKHDAELLGRMVELGEISKGLLGDVTDATNAMRGGGWPTEEELNDLMESIEESRELVRRMHALLDKLEDSPEAVPP